MTSRILGLSLVFAWASVNWAFAEEGSSAELTPTPTPSPTPETAVDETPAVAETVAADAADASSAPAWPTTLSLSHEFLVRHWQEEEFTDTVQRLFLTDNLDPVFLSAQLDGVAALPRDKAALFATEAPPHAFETGLFILEKKYLRWTGSSTRLEAGDTYRAPGRGIALALTRSVELDIDTSLEGAAVDHSFGTLRVGAFGGLSNPQTVSMNFRNGLELDARDRIVGGEVQNDFGSVRLGAHVVDYLFDPLQNNQTDLAGSTSNLENARVAGVSLEGADLMGHADLFLESDFIAYEGQDALDPTIATDDTGYAVYGSVTTYLRAFSVQVEGKSYNDFEALNLRSGRQRGPYDYSAPPTLEKEDVVTSNISEAVNSHDIYGGRVTGTYMAGPWQYLASYSAFQNLGELLFLPGGVRNFNEEIHHMTAGVEHRGGGSVFALSAGGRIEGRLAEPEVRDTLVHANADVLMPIGSVAVESKVLAYQEKTWELVPDPTEQSTIDTVALTLSARPRPWVGVAAFVDYTTDPLAAGALGEGVPGNAGDDVYVSGEIEARPTSSASIRLFGGSQKGGLKCSGGTCRVLPPFNGVRLEGVYRF